MLNLANDALSIETIVDVLEAETWVVLAKENLLLLFIIRRMCTE